MNFKPKLSPYGCQTICRQQYYLSARIVNNIFVMLLLKTQEYIRQGQQCKILCRMVCRTMAA